MDQWIKLCEELKNTFAANGDLLPVVGQWAWSSESRLFGSVTQNA
jgi:hypothetical protein